MRLLPLLVIVAMAVSADASEAHASDPVVFLRSGDSAEEASVTLTTSIKTDKMRKDVGSIEVPRSWKKDDMVQWRTTAPLFEKVSAVIAKTRSGKRIVRVTGFKRAGIKKPKQPAARILGAGTKSSAGFWRRRRRTRRPPPPPPPPPPPSTDCKTNPVGHCKICIKAYESGDCSGTTKETCGNAQDLAPHTWKEAGDFEHVLNVPLLGKFTGTLKVTRRTVNGKLMMKDEAVGKHKFTLFGSWKESKVFGWDQEYEVARQDSSGKLPCISRCGNGGSVSFLGLFRKHSKFVAGMRVMLALFGGVDKLTADIMKC